MKALIYIIIVTVIVVVYLSNTQYSHRLQISLIAQSNAGKGVGS